MKPAIRRAGIAAMLCLFCLASCANDPVRPDETSAEDGTSVSPPAVTEPAVTDSGPADSVTPVPPVSADPVSVLQEDGSLTLHKVKLNANRYYVPQPVAEAYYGEDHVIVILWDRTEDGRDENIRLTFCDLNEGRMTGWEYPLTNVPYNMIRAGEDVILYGMTASGQEVTYFGWRISGEWTMPTVTPMTQAELESARLTGEDSAILSPDGRWRALRKNTDGWGNGGLWLEEVGGEGKLLRENVVFGALTDDQNIGDVRGYYPIAFQNSSTLVYGIGGWEWPVGYGYYDLQTGEFRQVENGRGVLAVAGDCLYTAETSGYTYKAVYKEYADGREVLLADRETCPEMLYPFLKYTDGLTGFSYTPSACAFSYNEDMAMGIDSADKPMHLIVLTPDLQTVRMHLTTEQSPYQQPVWILHRDTLLLFGAE